MSTSQPDPTAPASVSQPGALVDTPSYESVPLTPTPLPPTLSFESTPPAPPRHSPSPPSHVVLKCSVHGQLRRFRVPYSSTYAEVVREIGEVCKLPAASFTLQHRLADQDVPLVDDTGVRRAFEQACAVPNAHVPVRLTIVHRATGHSPTTTHSKLAADATSTAAPSSLTSTSIAGSTVAVATTAIALASPSPRSLINMPNFASPAVKTEDVAPAESSSASAATPSSSAAPPSSSADSIDDATLRATVYTILRQPGASMTLEFVRSRVAEDPALAAAITQELVDEVAPFVRHAHADESLRPRSPTSKRPTSASPVAAAAAPSTPLPKAPSIPAAVCVSPSLACVPDVSLTPSRISRMDKRELITECLARSLSTEGLKLELQARLLQFASTRHSASPIASAALPPSTPGAAVVATPLTLATPATTSFASPCVSLASPQAPSADMERMAQEIARLHEALACVSVLPAQMAALTAQLAETERLMHEARKQAERAERRHARAARYAKAGRPLRRSCSSNLSHSRRGSSSQTFGRASDTNFGSSASSSLQSSALSSAQQSPMLPASTTTADSVVLEPLVLASSSPIAAAAAAATATDLPIAATPSTPSVTSDHEYVRLSSSSFDLLDSAAASPNSSIVLENAAASAIASAVAQLPSSPPKLQSIPSEGEAEVEAAAQETSDHLPVAVSSSLSPAAATVAAAVELPSESASASASSDLAASGVFSDAVLSSSTVSSCDATIESKLDHLASLGYKNRVFASTLLHMNNGNLEATIENLRHYYSLDK